MGRHAAPAARLNVNGVCRRFPSG